MKENRFEELLEEKLDAAYNDGMYDAVENNIDIINSAYEQTLELLEEDGATLSEMSFASDVLGMMMDLITDMLNDDYSNDCCDECCCECCHELA